MIFSRALARFPQPDKSRHGNEIGIIALVQPRRPCAPECTSSTTAAGPGAVLEFSHAGTANVQLKCRLVKIEEGQDKRVHVALIEHSPTLDALRNSVISPPPGCAGEDCEPPEDDPGDTDPGTCEEARGGTGSLVAWFNGGGPYAPGTYFISARRPASNRHYDAPRDPEKHWQGRYHGGAPPVRCRYPSRFLASVF